MGEGGENSSLILSLSWQVVACSRIKVTFKLLTYPTDWRFLLQGYG